MLLRYLILQLFLLFTPWDSLFALEVVNPHWTGQHCSECHLEDNPLEKGVSLRNNGNVIKLCTRCHNGNTALAEIHPYGGPQGMKIADVLLLFTSILYPQRRRIERRGLYQKNRQHFKSLVAAL